MYNSRSNSASNFKTGRARSSRPTAFVQVMENLESRGILQFYFQDLESPEI